MKVLGSHGSNCLLLFPFVLLWNFWRKNRQLWKQVSWRDAWIALLQTSFSCGKSDGSPKCQWKRKHFLFNTYWIAIKHHQAIVAWYFFSRLLNCLAWYIFLNLCFTKRVPFLGVQTFRFTTGQGSSRFLLTGGTNYRLQRLCDSWCSDSWRDFCVFSGGMWCNNVDGKTLTTFLGGGFKHFFVHPYLGKIPILTNIFQLGWNHHLVLPIRRNFFGDVKEKCVLPSHQLPAIAPEKMAQGRKRKPDRLPEPPAV